MYSSTSLYEGSEADVCNGEDTQGSMLFQETLAVSRRCWLEESQKLLLEINFAE